ncbi:MAG: RNA polymerase subunit sigma-70 [Gammaproteobacteria bacterium]|nr:MAG: RNA polymerase subunit sigma-70 [Gammaproteobacteria bacterium]RLA35473.1 MAG: RNA polymerase subunit sigma-70 [Gammaproteobacteria bacterium]
MNINEIKHELVTLGGGAHALASNMLGNPDDASDAVQDAFTTVLGKPLAYDAQKGPLKPWFLRIVRNRCLDLLRRRRPAGMPVDELTDKGATPEQAAELDDRDRELKLALATITNEQRQIVILRDHLDLPYAEIAIVLDIAPGTVMSRLHRARLALREVLKSYE